MLWRGTAGGLGGCHGPLPEPGGSLDQAAVMMEAFTLMAATENQLREKKT